MTTSSSDRCTRISPSAVLDDRLDGKDLEWARDHLRRCEACRERVEDFREMLLRVGRLPKATVGGAAMDQAYGLSVPERLRDEAGIRSYELSPPDTSRMAPPPAIPSSMPDLNSVSDMMSELEREIYRDQPQHPTPLPAATEPFYPTFAPHENGTIPTDELPVEEAEEPQIPATIEADTQEEQPIAIDDEPVQATEPEPKTWREVPIESHPVEPATPKPAPADETDWTRLLERIANAPEPIDEPAVPSSSWSFEPASSSVVPPEPATKEPVKPPTIDEPTVPVAAESEPAYRNVIFDQEPALTFDQEPPAPPPTAAASVSPTPDRSDTVARLAVGFGAAAVVLLAGVLYAGGYILKSHPTASVTTTASVKPSVHHSAAATHSASPTASAKPSPPPANVLFALGNGVPGNTIFRIRVGTAVAGFTRLVFDMHGNGLPSMVITQADPNHVEVMFMNTTVGNVAVNGIHSYQVAGIEPGVQTGPNASFTVDLARPIKVTAFTLPATGGYAWRLVVDLHTA